MSVDFPAFGRPTMPDVGDELELDLQLALLSGLARLRETRSLPRRRCEMLVAPPAPATLGDEDALAVVGQVSDELARSRVAYDRPDRQLDDHVGARLARAVRAHAVLATAALPLPMELQVVQGIQTPGRGDPD